VPGGRREKSISVGPPRAGGHSAAIYYSLVESNKATKGKSLIYLTHVG
jgi:hypothetical protein